MRRVTGGEKPVGMHGASYHEAAARPAVRGTGRRMVLPCATDPPMTTDRKTVVLATAVLLASWLMSSATSPQAPGVAPTTAGRRDASRDAVIDSLVRDVAHETTRLHERLTEAPAPRRPARDPFRFGSTPAPRPRRQVAMTAEAAPMPQYTPSAPVVPFKLIGIAENQADQASAIERKAILSGDGQLLIVGKDESVGARYLVVAIGADAVELFDSMTNQPLRLVLR